MIELESAGFSEGHLETLSKPIFKSIKFTLYFDVEYLDMLLNINNVAPTSQLTLIGVSDCYG